MVFPVVMYGCESWTIKKAKHQRVDAFECGAGEDSWRQEEKGMTEYGMVGWYRQLDGHEFEQAPGVGDGQGSQAYYI